MKPKDYFLSDEPVNKKKYDALREFFLDELPADQVAKKYGYTQSAFYSLTRDFRKHLQTGANEDLFFKEPVRGRKPIAETGLAEMVIGLRKQNYAAEEIVGIVNAQGHQISYGYVYQTLNKAGFARLPRRSVHEKEHLSQPRVKAPIASALNFTDERFYSTSTGLFLFLPLIRKYGLDELISQSEYPQTRQIDKLSSIFSFVFLKLSNIKRYSNDDLWCMDRGLGLIAGLNVLPKSAWLSSYSSRVTHQMNRDFLKGMHQIWLKEELLGDTVNLDFTTIPYWGGDDHLENNWSGKRNKALSSLLAVLAQDPDSGIIDYGNSDVQHKSQSSEVLEYLDFYRKGDGEGKLRYLVFDSRFTNYENLSGLDNDGIRFITIRRRGKKVVEGIESRKKEHKTVRVDSGGNKKRVLKVLDEMITLTGYKDQNGASKPIRQIAISGSGKIRPALIITNDFERSSQEIVRKYARRWLIEKGISEQIEFFHLNRVSSSMVIKVDFDLTMTILAHNIYRLLARELGRYSSFTAQRIYNKFISNSGSVEITEDNILVELKKKRDLPLMLEWLKSFEDTIYPWLGNRKMTFYPSATS